MQDVEEITGRQFVERFALAPARFAWLLGAGASAAAGIPTGYQMIQEFRSGLFSRKTGVSLREVDFGDPIWEQRIDVELARDASLPRKGDPTEYSAAFEALYPQPEDRRLYMAKQVEKGTPSVGHRALGAFLASGRTPIVFTTNFDKLVEDAATVAAQLLPAGERRRVVDAAIDNAERAERCLRENDWPLVAKLHGDYQSVELKNTGQELLDQDARMRRVLGQACQRFGLIVVGYSGRDASVMEALGAVLREETAFPAGIVWLCHEPAALLPAVKVFLENAALAGVRVTVVSGNTFDEFACNLADGVEMPTALMEHVFGPTARAPVVQAPLSKEEARRTPVLRLSAVPILEMPKAARRLALKSPTTSARARELLKEAKVYGTVAWTGAGLAAFGKDEELLRAFEPLGPTLAGEATLDPTENSWALGLIYDALVRAVCRGRPLHPRMTGRGHTVSVSYPRDDAPEAAKNRRARQLKRLTDAYGTPLVGTPGKLEGKYSEGVHLRIDRADGRWWCVFEPATFLDFRTEDDSGDDDDADAWSVVRSKAADWRRERWAARYNRNWASIIEAWVAFLTHSGNGALAAHGLASGEGVDALFRLGDKTGWSRPLHHHAHFDRARP